jgi:charged multivesicular body protein 7
MAATTTKVTTPIFTLSSYSTTPLTRLPALYSNVTSRKHSDPASYHSAVDWWRRVLEEYVFSGLQDRLLPETWRGSSLILRAWPGLLDVFRVEGAGKPLALGSIIVSVSFLDWSQKY